MVFIFNSEILYNIAASVKNKIYIEEQFKALFAKILEGRL